MVNGKQTINEIINKQDISRLPSRLTEMLMKRSLLTWSFRV